MGIEGNCDFRSCYRQSASPIYDGNYFNSERPSIDPLAVYVATGGVDDPANGSEGSPYATPGYAMSQNGVGTHVYMRGGTYNLTVATNVLASCEVEPYPGETVIIDMGANDEAFILNGANNAILRGLQCQNTSGQASIFVEDNSDDILLEDLIILNHDNPASGGNSGGIYLGFSSSTLIQRATLRNIRIDNITVNGGTGSQVNASGVHSYACEGSLLENMTISNSVTKAGNGVRWKRATGNPANTIKRCKIFDVTQGVSLTVGGAGDPPHIDQVITECEMYNIAQNCIFTDAATSSINDGLEVSNCVLDDNNVGHRLKYFQNVNIYNNIVIGSANSAIDSKSDMVYTADEIDENCYYNNDSFRWNESPVASLSAWQSTSNQDSNSNLENPQFVDEVGRDYRVQNSALLGTGRGGFNYGSYKTGTETIGATV